MVGDGRNDQGGLSLGGDVGVDFGRLQQTFESLSLTGMESRTMVALLGLGTATLAQLSHLTGISRSNLYPVLDSLAAKALCQRVPGRFALWTTPEPNEVCAILRAAEEAAINSARQSAMRHLDEAQALLGKLPETKRRQAPITLVDDARLTAVYSEALASVDTEILVLNRGPYAGDMTLDRSVLQVLARGVMARALYVSAELEATDALRLGADAYSQAGAELRVIDSLPASMAVIGNDTVLLSLPSGDASSEMAAHGAVIRHQGMVKLQVAAFEHLWAQARPYVPSAGGARDAALEHDKESVGGT